MTLTMFLTLLLGSFLQYKFSSSTKYFMYHYNSNLPEGKDHCDDTFDLAFDFFKTQMWFNFIVLICLGVLGVFMNWESLVTYAIGALIVYITHTISDINRIVKIATATEEEV